MTDPRSARSPLTDLVDARDLRDEPFEPTVVHSDVVYKGWVWDVRSDRIGYGDGELIREYVDHTGAVAVLALDDDGRVMLIQQYRHPIRHRDWELPAGLLDIEGEDPLLAAQRELAEETDLVARDWQLLVSTWTTPGGNSELIRIYLATGIETAPTAHDRTDEEADIRTQWVLLSDAVDAVLDGRLRNGILAVGVLAAERRLRR